MAKRQILTTAYDKRAKFAEIKPLLEQIHEFCQANEIPYIFAANLVVDTDDETHETCSSALLIGPERTPPELAIANIAVMKGVPEAMQMAALLLAKGYTGEHQNDEGDAKPEPTTVH